MDEESLVIDTPEKANWAIKKVKEEQARYRLYAEAADKEIEQLALQKEEQRKNASDRTAWFISALDAYLDQIPARQTKTQRSFELPAGKIVRKLPKTDYAYDKDRLTDYLLKNAPDYIKEIHEPKWEDFKKDLEIIGDTVIRKSTGEVVEVVHTVDKPSTTEIV